MFYISIHPDYDEFSDGQKLFLLKDMNGNVVDSRWAKNETDAMNTFLRNHKELREEDIE